MDDSKRLSTRDALVWQLGEIAAGLNSDELAVLCRVAAKLAGEGRQEHGELALDTDHRDLLGEMLDEATDALAYAAMAIQKHRGRG